MMAAHLSRLAQISLNVSAGKLNECARSSRLAQTAGALKMLATLFLACKVRYTSKNPHLSPRSAPLRDAIALLRLRKMRKPCHTPNESWANVRQRLRTMKETRGALRGSGETVGQRLHKPRKNQRISVRYAGPLHCTAIPPAPGRTVTSPALIVQRNTAPAPSTAARHSSLGCP